ncbi:MAG: AI-2E family transporter, partial [Chloroflexi bacterium]|nr:AI-2E family transporter [Chloroflexota bacterium]
MAHRGLEGIGMSEQEIRSPRWGGTTKLIIGLTTVTLIGLTVWRFQIVIAPLVTAVVIAYFLNPFITFLSARLRWPRTAVVAIIYLSLLLALIALVAGLGLVVVNQISNLNLNIQQIVESLPGRIDALLHSN